jgi:hypothetical protein
MKAQRFKAKLEGRGRSGAWSTIRAPFDVEKAFGSRARVSVRGTINGFAYRSSIFPDGDGNHFMMVNKAMQAGAEVGPGDVVVVIMERDDAPRAVAVPAELAAALRRSKAAREFFEGLSASCRKEYAEWVRGAKRDETRAKRAGQAVEMLASGRKRLT